MPLPFGLVSILAFSMTGRNRGSTVFQKLLSPILKEKDMQISTSFLSRIRGQLVKWWVPAVKSNWQPLFSPQRRSQGMNQLKVSRK